MSSTEILQERQILPIHKELRAIKERVEDYCTVKQKFDKKFPTALPMVFASLREDEEKRKKLE